MDARHSDESRNDGFEFYSETSGSTRRRTAASVRTFYGTACCSRPQSRPQPWAIGKYADRLSNALPALVERRRRPPPRGGLRGTWSGTFESWPGERRGAPDPADAGARKPDKATADGRRGSRRAVGGTPPAAESQRRDGPRRGLPAPHDPHRRGTRRRGSRPRSLRLPQRSSDRGGNLEAGPPAGEGALVRRRAATSWWIREVLPNDVAGQTGDVAARSGAGGQRRRTWSGCATCGRSRQAEVVRRRHGGAHRD